MQATHAGTGAEGDYSTREVDLQLAERHWINRQVLVMGLSDASKRMGTRVDGFLGRYILRTFWAVRIDYRAHEVEFESSRHMQSLDESSVVSEARALYRILGAGSRIEELRELIAVPPRIERRLRACARMRGEDVHWISVGLKFRQSVAREFQRLLHEGPPRADLPETDESESCAIEETSTNAQRYGATGITETAKERGRQSQ